MQSPLRRSVDLSSYPDLVVIYLGYRANRPRGLLTLLQIGKGLMHIKRAFPPGLLAHEFFMLGPLHVGFRQYWTDLESLQTFTKAPRHAAWWSVLGKDTKGGGFWHETYCRRGGIEAMYIDMPAIGLGLFAPPLDPVGSYMTFAQRLGRSGGSAADDGAPVSTARPEHGAP